MKFNLNLDNINYIKIVYKDKNDNACCTKAAIKNMNEREIYACAKFEDGLYIEFPQEISLSFVCDNGLYRTNTTLKYVENKNPFVFFYIKTPFGIEYQQNREYFRVRMDEDVIMTFNQTSVACKVHDISANGIRIILPKKINIPEEVTLDILFRPKNVKTKAKLIRIDNEENILKASFEYLEISKNDVDLISQKCIQKQLEYKRNVNLK